MNQIQSTIIQCRQIYISFHFFQLRSSMKGSKKYKIICLRSSQMMPALAKPRGNQISSSSSCPRDLKMQIPRALTQTNRTIRAIMQKMWTHLKMILRKIIRVAIQKKWRLSLIIRLKTSRQTVKIMQVPRNRSLLIRMQIAARRIKIRKKWPKKKSPTLVWNPTLSRSKMRKISHQQLKKMQRKYLTKWRRETFSALKTKREFIQKSSQIL